MDTALPPEPLRWPAGEKLWHMQKWSQTVMADAELTKAALRIAWSLVFSFHNEEARSWETKETLAKRTGMSLSSVKNGLIDLERHGHIIRSFETVNRKRMRVIRPRLNSAVLEREPRKRRGGKGSEPQADIDGWWPEVQTPGGTEVQPAGGTEVQTPCILDSSFENPSTVGDVAETGGQDPNQGVFGLRCCECPEVAEYQDPKRGKLFCGDCRSFDSCPIQER